jgi:transcription initiation factor TFIIIB Brf1 subunit/transcription initiation factor TFIIB
MAMANNTIGKSDARSMLTYYNMLQKESNAMIIPPIIKKTAWNIVETISKKKYSRGRSMPDIVNASIYYACKVHGYPAFRYEFYVDGDKHGFNISYNTVFNVSRGKYQSRPVPFIAYMNRAMNMAGIPFSAYRDAFKIFKTLSGRGYRPVSKNPLTVIAGIVYVACKDTMMQITQHDISEMFHVTEVSVRARIKEITSILK